MAHLIEAKFLDVDGDVLFIGPESERRFGRRHFLDLMAVFLAAPEVKILNGREEVGSVDPIALTMKRNGPRVIALGGRSWLVTYIDWKRHRAYVEPVEGGGQVQWSSPPVALSPELCDAMRRVLLGETPVRVSLSRRATDRLATLRRDRRHQVDELSRVIVEDSGRVRWWTWAGLRQNARYVAALDAVAPELLDDTSTYDNLQIALRGDADAYVVTSAMRTARSRFGNDLGGVTPEVDNRALRGLKFAELLPIDLAHRVLMLR